MANNHEIFSQLRDTSDGDTHEDGVINPDLKARNDPNPNLRAKLLAPRDATVVGHKKEDYDKAYKRLLDKNEHNDRMTEKHQQQFNKRNLKNQT